MGRRRRACDSCLHACRAAAAVCLSCGACRCSAKAVDVWIKQMAELKIRRIGRVRVAFMHPGVQCSAPA